ncbi:hypothetical protein EDB83DRAFT_2520714 [Lactarius deliciosus]|nr:hypothetical protein EDB83DRAFT_2520714 [Lactarius deliciosus]
MSGELAAVLPMIDAHRPGCHSWPVEVDVRGREAEGKQDLVLENAYAWLKRACTTTPTLPSRSAGWYQHTIILWYCSSTLVRLLIMYKLSGSADGRVISAGMRIRCYCSSWF